MNVNQWASSPLFGAGLSEQRVDLLERLVCDAIICAIKAVPNGKATETDLTATATAVVAAANAGFAAISPSGAPVSPQNEQQVAEMLALLRQIATDIKESNEVLAHWDSRGLPPENTGLSTSPRRKPKVQSAPQ